MKPQRMSINVKLPDSETLEVEVKGIFVPEEPMVMYYADGSGYPGSPQEFEVDGVELINGTIDEYTQYLDDFYTLQCIKIKHNPLLNIETIWEYLEKLVLDKINNNYEEEY